MEKKSVIKKITGSREVLLAVILVLLFAAITAVSPGFLSPKSLMDLLKNNAVTMVMALGMLCVMLVGGIDISIMSTLALSGMAIGMLLKYGHISSTVLAFVIALAIDGKKMDSVRFSGQLERLGIEGCSHIQFIIGGSLGLADFLLERADMKLSFSDMTFPHQLMRVILLEQIYRGYRIMNHEPYHK